MAQQYRVWMHALVDNACDLLDIVGWDEKYRLFRGVSLQDEWPNGVMLRMNEENPNDLQLTDSLFNPHSMLVVSSRLATFLEESGIPSLECLPVGIENHKGRLVDEPYFVLNLSEHVDALDASKSKAEVSPINGKVSRVSGLTLRDDGDATALLSARPMCRLSGFAIPTLVSRELAGAIDTEGFTGIRWGALEDFEVDLF